jgi:hypothetical protein
MPGASDAEERAMIERFVAPPLLAEATHSARPNRSARQRRRR